MKIDTTIPHPGRIYDYVLGGNHNFEADRIAAQKIIDIFAAYPTWARLNRWFLHHVAEQWGAEGHARVLDLGSGLPTQGHFHEALPSAEILYTDQDPIAVVYGQQILAGMAGKSYAQVDLTEPERLIEAATRVFGDRPRIAVGFIGVGYFLDDDTLTKLGSALHAWCAPGSVMAFSSPYETKALTPEERRAADEISARFRDARMTLYGRPPERVAELLAPWKLEVARPVEKWLDAESLLHADDWQETSISMSGMLFSRSASR
jgi:O-methyltransferase involved in polyketide biosynthesis